MRRLNTLPVSIAVAAITLQGSLVATQVRAQEEIWQALLRQQLVAELNCELNYTTNVRKYELGGQQMVDARAHCKDKRMYDVSWRPELEKFDIRSCEPVEC